jgi:hypothetical protein
MLIQPEVGHVIPVARHGDIIQPKRGIALELEDKLLEPSETTQGSGRALSDNEEEPRQTEEERHQQACKVINFANEMRQARLDAVMTKANEIKSKVTPLPNLPQQIKRRKREDLKRNKARQVRRSEAQRIRQTPVRPRMSMEFEKLAFLGDPMQGISRCKRCGAIPHVAGETCLWKPAVDSVEVEEDDEEKEATLWCDPDSPFAALHKTKEATTVHQCLFSQCPDKGEHMTAVSPTLHARCVRCSLRGHREATEIMGAEGTLVPACPDSKKNSLQDSIVAFKKAADLGILTQFRRSCPSMGYFPCRSVRHERLLALVSYDQMLQVNVETALATIRGWGTDLVEKFNLPDMYDESDENVLHALERFCARCMTLLGTHAADFQALLID